eukprot:1136375-Pelagomonas_calceolata.AAC.3
MVGDMGWSLENLTVTYWRHGSARTPLRSLPGCLCIANWQCVAINRTTGAITAAAAVVRSSPEKHTEHDPGRNRGDVRKRKGGMQSSPLPAQASLQEPLAQGPPHPHSSSTTTSNSALAAWFHAHYSLLAKAGGACGLWRVCGS